MFLLSVMCFQYRNNSIEYTMNILKPAREVEVVSRTTTGWASMGTDHLLEVAFVRADIGKGQSLLNFENSI